MNAITTLKAALALALGVAAQGVLAKDGTVNFKGSIIDAPCSIMGGDANQTVDLGQISSSVLSAGVGTRSPLVDFSIKLTGCGATAKTARVTFAATANPENGDLLAVTGGATGVGIQVSTGGGQQVVTPGVASLGFQLNQGDNELKFQAAYVSTNVLVQPGTANATAQFTVSYQ
ncbi:fimbrial protein [Ectopseudomonas khazarica]|uniref:Fimbrial protein n=1 Tax=Ectopseudomonas khazarica TaxID=2502979 RepID=A0ABW7MCL6_9GAMM